MRRVIVIIALLVFSTTGGVVQSAQVESDPHENTLLLPTYSKAVQLAFARVSDLENYDADELSEVDSWLVVTGLVLQELYQK